MERKPQGRVIEFPKDDSLRKRINPQPEGPEPPTPQGNILRSPGRSAHSMRVSYWMWVHKLARYHRVTPECVNEQVLEAMQQRKAA